VEANILSPPLQCLLSLLRACRDRKPEPPHVPVPELAPTVATTYSPLRALAMTVLRSLLVAAPPPVQSSRLGGGVMFCSARVGSELLLFQRLRPALRHVLRAGERDLRMQKRARRRWQCRRQNAGDDGGGRRLDVGVEDGGASLCGEEGAEDGEDEDEDEDEDGHNYDMEEVEEEEDEEGGDGRASSALLRLRHDTPLPPRWAAALAELIGVALLPLGLPTLPPAKTGEGYEGGSTPPVTRVTAFPYSTPPPLLPVLHTPPRGGAEPWCALAAAEPGVSPALPAAIGGNERPAELYGVHFAAAVLTVPSIVARASSELLDELGVAPVRLVAWLVGGLGCAGRSV
jgi:hypothetical protein